MPANSSTAPGGKMRSAKLNSLLASLVILTAANFIPPADAQVEIAVTGVIALLAGKKVSSIIQEISQAGASLINQGELAGNGLAIKVGNEANVLASNVSIQMKDVLNKTFEQLNDQQKKVLVEAYILKNEMKVQLDKAYDIRDTTVLDLNALVSKVPFVTNDWFVQRVKGTAWLKKNSDYKLTVMATKLGIDATHSSVVNVLINDKPIKLSRVDQSSQRGVADVYIPPEQVNHYFKETALVTLPVKVKVSLIEQVKFMGMPIPKVIAGMTLPTSVTEIVKDYSIPVSVTLYPSLAASAKVTSRAPVYDWQAVAPVSNTRTTADHHDGGRHFPYTLDIPVPGATPPTEGSMKLENPQFRCVGGACAGWFHVHYCDVTDQGRRVRASWEVWSRPQTWLLTANAFRWSRVGESTDVKENVSFYFDQPVEIEVAENSDYQKLEGTTFTKEPFAIITGVPNANPAASILHYQGTVSGRPGFKRIVYSVDRPEALK